MTLERFIDEVMANEDKNNLASKIDYKSKKKLKFDKYVKKFNKKLIKDGRSHLIPYMKDDYYKKLYNKSGYAKNKLKIKHDDKTTISNNFFKIKKISVTRYGKTYQRTIRQRWEQNSKVLEGASESKSRSPEYQDYVNRLVESTGRSRQAVVKKIQRIRKQLKEKN
jgi:hypothetical protein